MKVLLYTAYFPPETGSGPHMFFEMGRELARRGHKVGVITGMPHYYVTADASLYRGRLGMRETMAGMEVMRLAVPQLRRSTHAGRGMWHMNAALTSAIASWFARDYEVAAVFSPPFFLGFSAWLRRLPFLLNIQDLFTDTALDLAALQPGLLLSSLRKMEDLVYRRAAVITVHAPGQVDWIARRGIDRDKIVHLPNWVNTDEVKPGDRNNSFRRELGIGAESFVVSFAGVIGRAQGLDAVLGAAEMLRNDLNLLFLIVGDGLEKARLEAQARSRQLSNVRFLPMQPRERYPEVLAASDVCLVTLDERLRVPVVPSKVGSILAAARPMVISGHHCGLLARFNGAIRVPPNDGVALAAAIRRLRDDPALRQQVVANSREFAEQNLSLHALAPRFEALLKRCLSENR